MRIFLSLIWLISLNAFGVCEFKSEVTKVFSLSGSTTVLLRELGLLNHSKVKGISVFNPVKTGEFSGKVYPGGIFLSRDSLTEFYGGLVFYDESRELTKILTPMSAINSREIRTRSLSPLQAFDKTLKEVSFYLKGCEDKARVIREKFLGLEKQLLEKIPAGLPVVFYLGELRGERFPEMVVVNDGVVKWLKDKHKIKTYPSTLAYVNWSSRIMQSLPKNTLHVGIKDSGNSGEKTIKRSSQKMTLIYPGALVPGLSQLEAFLYWAQSL